MKNKFLLIFSFCLFIITKAQEKEVYPQPKFPELFKTLGTPIKESDPKWVKAMYSQNPNFYEVTRLYNEYYKNHQLKKNTHTQNYKHFYRIINTNHYYNEKGEVEIDEKKYLDKKIISEKLNAKGATAWTPLAPLETFGNDGLTRSSHVNVYCVEQSVTNPNLLYCGTETGAVFKSTDKAENWVEVGANVFDSGNSQSIKIDPTNENIVYVAHHTRLFKSIDGGQTWAVILNSSFQIDFEINPNNTNLIFVGGEFGLKRSTDAGLTWTDIFTNKVTDIEFKSDDPSVMFIAKENTTIKRYEIWKSTDSGISFTPKTTGWFVPTNGVALHAEGARIANTKADPNRLYVLLLGNNVSYAQDLNYVGVYRSDDAGESWTLPYDGNYDGQPDNQPGGPYSSTHWAMSTYNVNGANYDQGFYNACIDASDTDPDTFIVGMLSLFKSTNGGVHFTMHGGYGCTGCNNRYRHPDIQAILVRNGDAWVATDGGLDEYDSNLNFVDSKNKGITTCEFWGFDQGWNDDIVVGGRYHNGDMVYYDNYQDGNSLALGGAESATGFVNLGENKKTYFDDIGGKIIPDVITGAIVGIPSITKYPKSGNSLSKSEIVNDPRYWNHIYLGSNNQLWKSTNYGVTFSLLNTFGETGTTIRGIEISRKDPNLMFVAHHLGNSVKLWKSTNAGVSWVEVALPIYNYSFSFSLNEQNELFLCFDAGGNNFTKVYKSNNFGASWFNITTPTLNGHRIMDTEVQEGTNGGVYLIAQRTVFYTNNTMPDWVNISQGLPSSFRLLDAKPFYKKGKLRLAGNRGVWERDFFEVSKPQAQPMVSNQQTFCNRQEIQFEDYSTINHTGASWLWDFPGATSISSTTVRNPKVIYANPGNYNVTLTVTNSAGTSTKTVQNMITVNQSECTPKPLADKAINLTATSYLSKNISPAKNVTNFTFTAWIKPEGIQPDFSSIFYAPGITLDFKNGKNELGTHCNGLWWQNTGLIVPKDKWSFVALIYTPTKLTIVLNEKSFEINATFAAQNLTYIDLGIHNKRNDRKYKGLLEEVSLWDKALTLDEVRLNRHLTKTDVVDPNLFAYYQFNALNNDIVYDVKNTNDLSDINGSFLVDSYCPVGPGVSQKININQNNTSNNFATSNTTIETAGTNFNGDVVVTKLNVQPFMKPIAGNGIAQEYYVIDNYGANRDIGALTKLAFNLIPNSGAYNPNDIKLYQRERNSESSEDWVDKGSPNTTTNNNPIFNSINLTSTLPNNNDASNNTITESSGQFYLVTQSALGTNNSQNIDGDIRLYPNPVNIQSGFRFDNITDDSILQIYDASGKQIYFNKIKNNEVVKDIKSSGVYFYRIETKNKIKTGKIIVK